MYTLEFVRLENGEYTISDDNDQRLYMIGQILLDDALRNGVKKTLEYAPEFGVERRKDIETEQFHVRVSPLNETTCMIIYKDKTEPEEEALQTDMKIETLLDLIDSFENAVEAESESIMMTRSQDNFTLEPR